MHDDFQPGPRKTAQQVARRSIVLYCVASSGEHARDNLAAWLRREGLWDDASPAEQALLTSEVLDEKQRIDASWRWEALQAMLWSFSHLAELPPFHEVVDVNKLLALLPRLHAQTASFIHGAILRPPAEIDDQLDTVVHVHTAILQERSRRGKKSLAAIPGIVLERQWALEWIENFDDVPWDDIVLSA